MAQLLKANQQHIDELLSLSEQFYGFFNYKFNHDKHQATITHFLSNEHFGSLWLIQTDNQYVGYLALTYGFTFEFGGRDAFVDELFIVPKYQNKGLGKFALIQIMQQMPHLGLNAIHLQTEAYNERAKNLYLSLGFTDYKRSTLTYLWKT